MRGTRRSATALVLMAVSFVPVGARAQSSSERAFEAARARLQYEPTVADTLRAVLRYFRVDPESFDSLRKAAHRRALLPTMALGFRLDDTSFERFERQDITSPRENNETTGTRVNTGTLGGVWDLRDLVFNPAEVQIYGLIGVQRDLMLETTRIYYLRKQLFVRFLNRPPEDPLAREALLLRIEEFTSMLDVLSGTWFSSQTEKNVRTMRGNHGDGEGARARRPRRPRSVVRPQGTSAIRKRYSRPRGAAAGGAARARAYRAAN